MNTNVTPVLYWLLPASIHSALELFFLYYLDSNVLNPSCNDEVLSISPRKIFLWSSLASTYTSWVIGYIHTLSCIHDIFSSLMSTPNGHCPQNTLFPQDTSHRRLLCVLEFLFSEGFLISWDHVLDDPKLNISYFPSQGSLFPLQEDDFVLESLVLLPWAALLSPNAPYPLISFSHIPQSSVFLQVYYAEQFSSLYLCLSQLWPLSWRLYFSKQTYSPCEEICCQL